MKDFDAKQAKEIVDSIYNGELTNVLDSIKKEAEKGESELCVYFPLKESTIKSLKEKGFTVSDAAPATVQKDNLFYFILW